MGQLYAGLARPSASWVQPSPSSDGVLLLIGAIRITSASNDTILPSSPPVRHPKSSQFQRPCLYIVSIEHIAPNRRSARLSRRRWIVELRAAWPNQSQRSRNRRAQIPAAAPNPSPITSTQKRIGSVLLATMIHRLTGLDETPRFLSSRTAYSPSRTRLRSSGEAIGHIRF